MTPLVRVTNFTVEKLKEFLQMYEQSYQNNSNEYVEEQLENKKSGYKKTYYQWANQLGIQYSEEVKGGLFKYQEYLKDFKDEELKKYLEFWFMTYYAPNISVKGDVSPTMIYCDILKKLLSKSDLKMSYDDFKNLYLNHGSIDIMENCIKAYGKYIVLEKENNQVYIQNTDKNSAEDLAKKIEKYFPIQLTYKSRVEFFNRFNHENYKSFLKNILNEAGDTSYITIDDSKKIEGIAKIKDKIDALEKFGKWLESKGISHSSIKNYIYRVKKVVEGIVEMKLIDKEESFYMLESSHLEELLKKYFSNESIKTKEYSQYKSNTNKFVEFLKEFENNGGYIPKQKLELSDEHQNLYQRIIYGAPGTGKSNLLKTQTEAIYDNVERVTFYDGYTHGQFVGAYKPVPILSENEKADITYEYVAGTFMKQLVKALRNPESDYVLIIEEINRVRADKVFGNIFQLLDRDDSGKSEYGISLSEEQKNYLESEFGEERYSEIIGDKDELFLPKNFYIWATMNSADQGVYPMDSAFKRRWNFEYIKLNENSDNFGVNRENPNAEKPNYLIPIYQTKENRELGNKIYETTSWKDFRDIINETLLDKVSVPEDRLFAPFFVKPSNFSNQDMEYPNDLWLDGKLFTSKILMYLFDDILRHRGKDKIFKSSIKSFSKLIELYESGENIFNENITTLLTEKGISKDKIVKEKLNEEIEGNESDGK